MRLRKVLQQANIDLAILEQHELSARKEMDGVFAEAKAAHWPPLTRAFEDVQDIGDPRQEAF